MCNSNYYVLVGVDLLTDFLVYDYEDVHYLDDRGTVIVAEIFASLMLYFVDHEQNQHMMLATCVLMQRPMIVATVLIQDGNLRDLLGRLIPNSLDVNYLRSYAVIDRRLLICKMVKLVKVVRGLDTLREADAVMMMKVQIAM